MLLLDWPLVLGVCPNYEVVMFQPRTVTPPYLGSVVNCYVATKLFLNLYTLLLHPPDLLLRGVPVPAPGQSPVYFRRAATQDHSSIWELPVSVPASRYPSLPSPSSNSSVSLSPMYLPRLLDFQRRYLDAAEISFNVALS